MTRRRPLAKAALAMTLCLTVLAPVARSADAAVAPTFERAWTTGNGSPSLPVAIAADPASGSVYVSNFFSNRIERYDVDGAFLGQWGGPGSGTGQFNLPQGVAVGPDGSVYVADTGNNRIQRFTATGTFVATWGTAGSGNGQFNRPMGVAVDSSGHVYVTDTNNNRVQKFTATGTYRTRWGRGGTAAGRFNAPTGIAISADRKVYVVDTGNDRVQQFSGTGTFGRMWGAGGTGQGQFTDAYGVAVDGAGTVYVADPTANRVQAFSPTGTFQSSWGATGSLNGQFQGAWGVAAAPDGTRVLVTDKDNSRVQRFAPTPAGARPVFVSSFGGPGDGPAQMSQLQGVAVGPSGTVYVLDFGHQRMQRFSATGTHLSNWGSFGSGNGQFGLEWGVATDASGNVYVSESDSPNLRVQRFTATGTYVSQFALDTFRARGIAVDPTGNIYVVDPVWNEISRYSPAGVRLARWGGTGSGNGQFNAPNGIAIDASGNVYVADTGNNRIQKFTATGTFVTAWGTAGSGNSQFANPGGVAVDPAGFVYVADTGNNRLQKFTVTGTYLTQWGSTGTGNGQFDGPVGVAVNASGTIYVAESNNMRVQVFAAGSPTTPSLSLAADQTAVNVGDTIDYHVTITNTTADTLTGVMLGDPAAPDCEGPVPDVLPGASLVVDCIHDPGPDDAGPFANVVSLTSDQTGVISSNTVITQVGPAVTVTMTAPATVTATDTIAYSIGITNNTAGTLTGVRVTDDAVPSCAGPRPDLAAGATTTVNCTRTTTDADSGSTVFNAAVVDAGGTRAGLATAVTRVQGRVTGTVTGPGGPVAGAYVLALSRDFLPLRGDAVANGAGTYTLGLDPGKYYLAFLDPTGATAAEYYDNETSVAQLATNDLVTVTAGAGPATANATLAASGFTPPANPASISGTITDTHGPVAGVWVVAVNGGVRSATRTNALGQYTVANLPPGPTWLEFVDPSGTHAIRWYHNDNGSNPTSIPVVAGQAVTGVDETLPPYP